MIDITIVIVFMAGLSAMLKFYMPDKYVPAINFMIGIAVGYFYIDFGTVRENLMYGALIGLGTGGFIDMASVPLAKIKGKLM